MIRPIEEAHIGECVDVIRSSFMPVAREFGITAENAPRYVAFATTPERLRRQFFEERRPMFAYFNPDGKIVGYYSLRLEGDGQCELNNLCVLPSFRHQGIGEKLLRHAFAEAKARGCRVMNIGIVEENTVLRRWYESFGFEHVRVERYDFFPFTVGRMIKTL
ncbi:MAG: GNAT family N-acetyltransferase [Clostridiales bacterium]|nr:GNAT family N-acetyltransferase [Clostridiales bacterium]